MPTNILPFLSENFLNHFQPCERGETRYLKGHSIKDRRISDVFYISRTCEGYEPCFFESIAFCLHIILACCKPRLVRKLLGFSECILSTSLDTSV